MSFLSVNNLVKTYGNGRAAVTAVRDVTFDITEGEFTAVMGESGSGKTTLLSIIGAMNTPSSGTYLVNGIDVYALGQERRADFRREFLGFIFQSFHLVPYLTVLENVMLPLTVMKLKNTEKRDMALLALEQVGIDDKAHRLPGQISGGEQERTAIARAVVNEPPILLADEPTGNLDTRTSKEVMNLLSSLNESGTTIVMVTHSLECAGYAQRVLRLSDGELAGEDRVVTAIPEPDFSEAALTMF